MFSIAIPAYKSNFLHQCIKSILNQTVADLELIIINDQSPHNIDEIVASFSDPRISYFKNDQNIGAENLVNNWNKCLEKAKGEYFIMMGDDDVMEPDYLEEIVKLMHKYPALDVYHCRSVIIDEDNNPTGLTPSWPEFESVYNNIWHRIMSYRLQYISDFIYNTEALKKNGGYFFLPLAWGSDDISAFRAAQYKGIAHTDKPVFRYRETGYTISKSNINARKKVEALMLQELWFNEFLESMPSEPTDVLLRQNLQTLIPQQLKKRKIYTISQSLKHQLIKESFFYYKNKQRFGLGAKDVLKAVIRAMIK